MSLELPKGPGSWPKMTDENRQEVYEKLLELKGETYKAGREKLAANILTKITGQQNKYELNKSVSELGKTPVSQALLDSFTQAGAENPKSLMFYSLDYLVNGDENKTLNGGKAPNIDLLEPGDNVSIQKDENGRWLITVAGTTGTRFQGFLFPPVPTDEFGQYPTSDPNGSDELGQYPTSDPNGSDELGQYPTSEIAAPAPEIYPTSDAKPTTESVVYGPELPPIAPPAPAPAEQATTPTPAPAEPEAPQLDADQIERDWEDIKINLKDDDKNPIEWNQIQESVANMTSPPFYRDGAWIRINDGVLSDTFIRQVTEPEKNADALVAILNQKWALEN